MIMKKISLALFALLGLAVLISSCNKNDDDTFGPPTLNFIGGEGYIDEDATIVEGSTFMVGVAASSNTESGKDLSTLRLTRTMDEITFVDTTFSLNGDYVNIDFTFNAQTQGTGEVIEFVLTDKASQSATKLLTLTYEAASSAVTKYSGINIGSHNDDFGSFYAAASNTVYNITDATANQASVDFLYYLGATNGATIASPADGDAATVYPALSDWTNKNATLFQSTDITAAEFDAIGDTYSFGDFTGDLSAITALEEGQVIMFKTWDEKLGLVKVSSITSRGDYAVIDVVIED